MRSLVFLLALAMTRCLAADPFDPAIPCKTDKDCRDNVPHAPPDPFCRNGYCACKEAGTEIKNCSSADLAGQFVLGSCRLDQECSLRNSFCNTTIRRCQCRKEYVLSNVKRQCLKKAETADFPCADDKQCQAFSANMSCRNGVCGCELPGYHYAQDACHKTIAIGQACARNEECAHVHGALCTDRGVCDCAAETILGQNGRTCLPVAREMLDDCSEDAQCAETFPNAVCVGGKCECRARYHFEAEPNRCFVDKGLGEDCGNTFECHQPWDGNATEKKRLRCMENVCAYVENRATGTKAPISALVLSVLWAVLAS